MSAARATCAGWLIAFWLLATSNALAQDDMSLVGVITEINTGLRTLEIDDQEFSVPSGARFTPPSGRRLWDLHDLREGMWIKYTHGPGSTEREPVLGDATVFINPQE